MHWVHRGNASGDIVDTDHDRAFQFQMALRKAVQRHFDPKDNTERQLDFFMTAKCEGQSFTNFCVIATLEAILSVTATINTTLEGDYTFANDPRNVTCAVAWFCAVANVLLTALFIAEVRRIKKGHTSCMSLCESPSVPAVERQDTRMIRDWRRLRVVELFTWLSLIISMFQVVIGAYATASQVASSGWEKTAILISTIEAR